jgi:hypothetical protein
MDIGKLSVVACIVVVLCATVAAQSEMFYEFTVAIGDGDVIAGDISLKPGTLGQRVGGGLYRADLLSLDGVRLSSKHFDILTTIEVEDFDPDTGLFVAREVKVDTPGGIVHIPYFANGRQINIYDGAGELVLVIPVIQFANTCGDAICDGHESHDSCASDCPSGGADDYCDAVSDSICDPDCSVGDVDCTAADGGQESAAAGVLPLAAKVVIAGILLALFLLVVRARSKRSEF